jgi:predicted GNAT family acetyltransferase
MASLVGADGVGQVEDLYVEPEVRHRGLATALIHRAVADCRARGAGPVLIVADASDTPKAMYAAMGFRPLAVERKYLLRLAP